MKKEIELYCSKYHTFVDYDIVEKTKCPERKICAGCQYLVDYEYFINTTSFCMLDDKEQRFIFEKDKEYPYFKDHETIFYRYECRYRDNMGEGAICKFTEYCDKKG